jgi:hypothetical protein
MDFLAREEAALVEQDAEGTVEVLVGEYVDAGFDGKCLRFEGRELERREEAGERHVLYECGEGRYRIHVTKHGDFRELRPMPDIDPYTGEEGPYGFFDPAEAAALWPNGDHFAKHFPVKDLSEQ